MTALQVELMLSLSKMSEAMLTVFMSEWDHPDWKALVTHMNITLENGLSPVVPGKPLLRFDIWRLLADTNMCNSGYFSPLTTSQDISVISPLASLAFLQSCPPIQR